LAEPILAWSSSGFFFLRAPWRRFGRRPVMTTVMICSSNQKIVQSLQEQLIGAHYKVDTAFDHNEAINIMKYEKRDILIYQAAKDNFYNLLQASFSYNPAIVVHVFHENSIFCFYPIREQSLRLVKAMMASGLKLSPKLLKFTRMIRDGEQESALTYEVV
jgi:CheY-like chemotaxis protein